MQNPRLMHLKSRESVWCLDEIIKCFRRIPGYVNSVVRLEPNFVVLHGDEAIKRGWAALRKNHPIQAAIILACAKRRNQYAETDERARKEALRDEILRLTTWLPEDEWRKAVRMGLEIHSLPTAERRLEIATLMLNSGFSERAARSVLEAKLQRKAGRPASKRVLFVRALELMLVRPSILWGQLSAQLGKFQPGGQKPSSAGSIRKGVGELRRMLIEYRVELPPPWFTIEQFLQAGKNSSH